MMYQLAFMQNASFFPLTDPWIFGAPMKPEMLELLVTHTMPYGKYKGRLIADLPGHYLNWFARQGFPAGELGGLLALMHEVDHNGLSDLLVPLRALIGK
jgi:uncharacterized protein (DUF3820 family)